MFCGTYHFKNARIEFTQTVSTVLEHWQFPGERHVSFDETLYDLRIDGKRRRDNGKGVRAITHAAFIVYPLPPSFGDYVTG